MTKNALLEKWPKKSVDPPPPLLIRAMPERKRFFFIDVFSNGHLQLQPWLEQHKRRCLSYPGLWSPPGSPRRPSCAKPLPTQVSDFEHDFVDLWPKMLGGSFPLLKAVTGQDRVQDRGQGRGQDRGRDRGRDAPNMVKWGVPEKTLQNAVQTGWS